MSDIKSSLSNRLLLIPKLDTLNDSHKDILKMIMNKHGEDDIVSMKMIDENDSYDSFLVETENASFTIKISFDKEVIFYEFLILRGIHHLQISPVAIDRNEIEFCTTIYYTIQSYEHSNNLLESGLSSINSEEFSDLHEALSILHSFEVPEEVHSYLDDSNSFFDFNKKSFENILQYVDPNEVEIYEFISNFYSSVHSEMINILNNNRNLECKKLVHGNLRASTIIENSLMFKFINFENCFLGNPLFDICNLVFELNMTGINEFSFVSQKTKDLNAYKICKQIWIRKKMLDVLNNYVKEVIILNSKRSTKLYKLIHEFSSNFEKFKSIPFVLNNEAQIKNALINTLSVV